jgi:hypothetical protein
MEMWNGATLYLRSDLPEEEAKAIIEEAKRMIGSGDFLIKTRENMPWQARLRTQNGEGMFWDSKLPDSVVSYKVSPTDKDNHYRILARIGKRH